MLRTHAASAPGDPSFRAAVVPRAGAGQSEGVVKQVEDATFVDLIACERGVCPHNGYCPCVNPVVARSKTALRLIELRPILLQDARGRI